MPVMSKTLICNMAVAHCGVLGRIQDVDSENSVEAINCRLFYDHCLSTLLELQGWPFAKQIDDLQDIGSPPDGWAYRYKYPNFCALAIKIVNPATRNETLEQRIPFKIVNIPSEEGVGYGRAILTDQENAQLEYNLNITDPNLFSSTFTQGFALLLASHIAMPLRVDPNIKASVSSAYTAWIAEAGTLALREAQEDIPQDSEFVQARR